MPPDRLPSPAYLLQEAIMTPRQSARRILSLGLTGQEIWAAAALGAILTILVLYLGMLLAGPLGGLTMAAMVPQPFLLVALQLGFTAFMALLVARLGAWAGGQGNFAASLTVMVWLQFILLAVQVVQLVLSVVLAPLAALISIGSIALFFWLLTNFVAEVHGFRNLAQVLVAVVMSMIAAAMGIALLFSLILGSIMGPM